MMNENCSDPRKTPSSMETLETMNSTNIWSVALATTTAVLIGGLYVLVRDRDGLHGFDSSTTAQQVIDALGATRVRGKRYLVTGCTPGGIGYETARVLARAGATVLVHARSESNARGVVEKLRGEEGVDAALLVPIGFDLASLDQVVSAGRALARDDAPALHGVALNAGLFAKESLRTDDGFELTFGVNQLAAVALFLTLLPKLRAAPGGARVVWLSSLLHAAGEGRFVAQPEQWARGTAQQPYDGRLAYAESKLAAVIVAQEAHRRFGASGVTSVSVHPGLITTNMTVKLRPEPAKRTLGERVGLWIEDNLMPHKSVPQGAATTVYALAAPEVDSLGGRYFSNAHAQSTVGFDLFGVPLNTAARRHALDAAVAAKYYDECESLVRPFLEKTTR
jgi:NAD(P)-dependent dehydrogenase (short-subunit alcohol dehydrogenase family)